MSINTELPIKELIFNGEVVDLKTVSRITYNKQELSTIDLTPEINYELSYDQLAAFVEGEHRIVYGADCADWVPATMDVNNTGLITDNGGLLEKWPFNQIKPCLVYQGQIIGYLNPNDYSLFENGTAADITNPDYEVMVEFPKIYYKLEHEWDNIAVWNSCKLSNVKIYISNKAKDGYVCYAHTRQGVEYDSIYISAYENIVNADGKLLCNSGVWPGNKFSHSYVIENLSTMKDAQYGTFNYHVATMLQILSMLLFKEYEGSYTYGNGFKNTNTNLFWHSGTNNTKGMFYGLFKGGDFCSKLFGLENILGQSSLILDGFMSTETKSFLVYDPTNPNCTINYNGTNYIEYAPPIDTYSGYAVRFDPSSTGGFLPVSRVPVASYGKPYYNCANTIKKPSEYTSAVDTSNKPYMLYSFGGEWDVSLQSLMTYTAMYKRDDNAYNVERLICYPNSKKS